VLWDRDIRPSDATYLAEECGAPIYVDSAIWQSTAITHKEFLAVVLAASTSHGATAPSQNPGGGNAASSTAATVEMDGSVEEVPLQDSIHRSQNGKEASGSDRKEAMVSASCSRAGILCAPFSLPITSVCCMRGIMMQPVLW
jgi:hypothetical protein